MNYENRLTFFIDLMGFQSAINQSLTEPHVRDKLFELITAIKAGTLESFVYKSLILLGPQGPQLAKDVFGDDCHEELHQHIRLEITQFSDSFVISAPADNPAACEMALKAMFALHITFFYQIGMLMRGGVEVGDLVHSKNGPLFGPAMNKAYYLESKVSVYPRVVFSEKAYHHISTLLEGLNELELIKKSFDGYWKIDVVDIFGWKALAWNGKTQISQVLQGIEADILKNSPLAHSKVAYLQHQWSQVHENFK